ncbi:MAG: NAD(P)/FAD-dependent oxidoreductase [Acidimicrobiales bacterium]
MSESESHVDVVVIGAGISGIGAAYHLQTYCPDRTFTVLEGRDDLGGTWDLFRYPGVRSDSDMHTLGYRFKPWTADKAIADGPSILAYLRETVAEFGLLDKIRFGHQATAANWSSEAKTWTITTIAAGQRSTFTCNFLFMCSGYYSYRGGHDPEFEGRQEFEGRIVHPQHWPDDLDYTAKDVVIIGSGATAVTLLPAMATDAASVTMLQRSPTYVVAAPSTDTIANGLRAVLPAKLAYTITRWKNVQLGSYFYRRSRKRPDKVKQALLKGVRKQLGDDYDIDTHFTPSYNPWDQRICLVPDGDLFDAINSGKGKVVTSTIDRFTTSGIRLTTGESWPPMSS